MRIGRKKHLLRKIEDGMKESARILEPPAKDAGNKVVHLVKGIHYEPHPRRRAFINFGKGLIPGALAGAIFGARLRAHRMRPIS
jgi:hypothetical protein